MVTWVFQLLLFITPIAVCADANLDMFDIILFRTGAAALFMASLLDKPKRQVPADVRNLLLGLFGLCLFNMFNLKLHPTVMANTLNTFLAMVAFCTVYTYLDTGKDIRKFILGAAFVNLIFYISQKSGFDPIFDIQPGGGFVGAFFGNTARLTTYFALVTPFLPMGLLPLCVLFGLYSGQYAIFIPVFIIIFMREKELCGRILLSILGLMFIILLRQHIITSISIRLNDAWFPVLKALFDRPLLGCGLGINPVPGSDLGVILNSYLQFIVGVGALGAVWYAYVLKVAWRYRTNILLLTLLALMFIEYPIEIPRFWFLIIAVLVTILTEGVGKDAGEDIGEVIIG